MCLLIQLRLRDYSLDNQNKAPIGPDDIFNIVPIVKHIHMPTVDASKAHRAAHTSIQKGGSTQAEPFFCSSFMFSVCFLTESNGKVNSVGLTTAGLLDQAHEHLKEAVYLFGRVCDDLHPEACYCHSLLAKVSFLQGKAAEVGWLLHSDLQLH